MKLKYFYCLVFRFCFISCLLFLFTFIKLCKGDVDTFKKVLKEKHLDWVFYSDDYRYLAKSRAYTLTSVSYSTNVINSKDLASTGDESSSQLILVKICANTSTFFEALEQICGIETSVESRVQWRPKYFIAWPISVKTPEEAEFTFRNTISRAAQFKKLSVDNNVYIAIPIRTTPDQIDANISLWESYVSNGHNNQSILTWNALRPMDWYNLTNKMTRRGNLNGAVIRVMAGDDPDYSRIVKFKKKHGQPEFESGTTVGLLWYLRDRINFTVEAVKGNWTIETLDGEITGGALEMENDIADLCISQTPMTPKREQHIHFLQPTYLEGLRAYFLQPSSNEFRDIYYKSFSLNLWVAIVSVWIAILLSMHCFFWTKNKWADNEKLDKDVLSESFLWALGAACQQGWHKQPVSFSMRLVFLIGYLTGLLCFVAFSASIVSSLSVKSFPFKTFADLTKAQFKMFVMEQSTAVVFLETLLKSQKDFAFIVNASVANSYLMRPQHTIITYAHTFQITTNGTYGDDFQCKMFSSIVLDKGPVRSAMMVQKGSPYTELFNYVIIQMRELGINDRFYQHYLRFTRPYCLDFSGGFAEPLELTNVKSPFYILLIGHVFSLVLLGGEKAYKFYSQPFNTGIYVT